MDSFGEQDRFEALHQYTSNDYASQACVDHDWPQDQPTKAEYNQGMNQYYEFCSDENSWNEETDWKHSMTNEANEWPSVSSLGYATQISTAASQKVDTNIPNTTTEKFSSPVYVPADSMYSCETCPRTFNKMHLLR